MKSFSANNENSTNKNNDKNTISNNNNSNNDKNSHHGQRAQALIVSNKSISQTVSADNRNNINEGLGSNLCNHKSKNCISMDHYLFKNITNNQCSYSNFNNLFLFKNNNKKSNDDNKIPNTNFIASSSKVIKTKRKCKLNFKKTSKIKSSVKFSLSSSSIYTACKSTNSANSSSSISFFNFASNKKEHPIVLQHQNTKTSYLSCQHQYPCQYCYQQEKISRNNKILKKSSSYNYFDINSKSNSKFKEDATPTTPAKANIHVSKTRKITFAFNTRKEIMTTNLNRNKTNSCNNNDNKDKDEITKICNLNRQTNLTDSVMDLNKLNKYKTSSQLFKSNFKRKFRLQKQQQKPPTQNDMMTTFDRKNLKKNSSYNILKNFINLSNFFISNSTNNTTNTNNNNNYYYHKENNLKNNLMYQNTALLDKNKEINNNTNTLNSNSDSPIKHYSV